MTEVEPTPKSTLRLRVQVQIDETPIGEMRSHSHKRLFTFPKLGVFFQFCAEGFWKTGLRNPFYETGQPAIE